MSHPFVEVRQKLEDLIHPGSVGDISLETGWIKLFEAFVDRLSTVPLGVRSGVTIHQIKEKYGQLRVYAYAPDEFFELTGALEIASGAICGVCGRGGCMREIGWKGIRCDLHSTEQKHPVRQAIASLRQISMALELLSVALDRRVDLAEFRRISNVVVHPMNDSN